jgi:hypothetical protein
MKHLVSLFILALFFLVSGCADNGANAPSTPGSSSEDLGKVSLAFSNAPNNVARVVARISREGYSDRVLVLVVADSTASGSFADVAIGTWHLRVDAEDDGGSVLYSGQTDVDVFPGQISHVSLHLQATTGGIEIEVTWGAALQALQFNGATDFISLPSSPSLTSFGNQISVEAWVKISAYSVGRGSWIVSSGNQDEYSFEVLANGKLGVTMVQVNPQSNAEFIGKSTLSLNAWYHIAFTYNGSVESILIDGVVDTSFSTSGNVSTSQWVENISMGAYAWNNPSPQHALFFSGILDEVRIWNVSRTPAQIQATMDTELSGSEAGLVGILETKRKRTRWFT